ncbi:MAG: hypothetical protein JJ909_05760 [Roseivirga sp.]|uniref:hypothetical protein n=1 Tax=Roseivirga sp. TaxID=1964215 RepID=UPI001B21587A|nr:hypothetical protein [Roseivirga sp.]MBO6659101.1 hypothetical protein [Roseivirga sp.]MBO6760465.1 hypothetical protein [Roseivirga sp.]MBO6908162.1 hypothetical protein [Roseivirga sp.]
MSNQENKFGTCTIGKRISKLGNVLITYSTLSDVYRAVKLSQETTGELQLPLPNQDKMNLKPYAHLSFDNNMYTLQVCVQVGEGYVTDPLNSIESLAVGKNLMIFLNYKKQESANSTPFLNYVYTIQFSAEASVKLKGKHLLIVTASGDPEEGSGTQVIVEDEDEI